MNALMYNPFEELSVGPEDSDAVIEAALERCAPLWRAAWGATAGERRRRQWFGNNAAQVRDVMLNPDRRRREARAWNAGAPERTTPPPPPPAPPTGVWVRRFQAGEPAPAAPGPVAGAVGASSATLAPPRGVVAKPGLGAVHVSWQPHPDPSVRYEVVRKTPKLELPLGVYSGTTAEDPGLPIGVLAVYAVVALRGEERSAPAHTGPVLTIGDVTELKARSDAGQVRLTWRSWDGVGEHRLERDPPFPFPRPAVAQTSFLDTSVEAGRSYTYTVRAVFWDPTTGAALPTAGATVTVTTERPLPAPEIVALQAGARRWMVSISGGGRVQLRRRPEAHAMLAGSVIPEEDLEQAGVRVADGEAPFPVDLEEDGRCVLTALRPLDMNWVVGPQRWIGEVPPPFDAWARRDGRFIQVTWRWPEGVTEVEARWALDGGATCTATVRRRPDERNAIHEIPVQGGGLLTVTLVSLVSGGELRSLPRELSVLAGVPTRVTFAVRRAAFAPTRAQLELRAPDGTSFPELHVVSTGRGPLSRENVLMKRVPPQSGVRGSIRVDLDTRPGSGERIRVRCADPLQAARFRFVGEPDE